MKHSTILMILLLGVVLLGNTYFDTTVNFSLHDRHIIVTSFEEYDGSQSMTPVVAMERYLRYYGLNTEHSISYGKVSVDTFDIAMISFRPEAATETVVLFHGFLDNSGVNSAVQNYLLSLGYAVVLVDLPGHGLSSGNRADITDFTIYGEVTDVVLKTLLKEEHTGDIHVIGHSTGCSLIEEQLRVRGKTWSGETILVAPLVRSTFWGLSKWSIGLATPFSETLKRVFRESSHNEEFLGFLKVESMRIEEMPLQWGNALHRWNPILESADLPNVKLTVIQGTDDGTVAWRHNLGFFEEKFPQVTIHRIEDGRHHLLNEGEPYRSEVYEIIANTLRGTEG